MKIRTLYTCEICHTDYNNESDAVNCERTHMQKLSIVESKYLGYHLDHSTFPIRIKIKNDNGDTIWYKRMKEHEHEEEFIKEE